MCLQFYFNNYQIATFIIQKSITLLLKFIVDFTIHNFFYSQYSRFSSNTEC